MPEYTSLLKLPKIVELLRLHLRFECRKGGVVLVGIPKGLKRKTTYVEHPPSHPILIVAWS